MHLLIHFPLTLRHLRHMLKLCESHDRALVVWKGKSRKPQPQIWIQFKIVIPRDPKMIAVYQLSFLDIIKLRLLWWVLGPREQVATELLHSTCGWTQISNCDWRMKKIHNCGTCFMWKFWNCSGTWFQLHLAFGASITSFPMAPSKLDRLSLTGEPCLRGQTAGKFVLVSLVRLAQPPWCLIACVGASVVVEESD